MDYSTPLPIGQWVPGVTKPLNVSLSAFANSSRDQKIYLTRVRTISPGVIVTCPHACGQVFPVPAVDDGATTLTIDFTDEFLLQVTPNSKDSPSRRARTASPSRPADGLG